jgi:AAHS family 4-hydroxybenzoate transporter-like MFS transporter
VLIYPSMMRATGLGWVMALGRMGQVIGPLVVGALVANGLTVERIFLCCMVPALCAVCATAFASRPRLAVSTFVEETRKR